jgi:hypothetical protein
LKAKLSLWIKVFFFLRSNLLSFGALRTLLVHCKTGNWNIGSRLNNRHLKMFFKEIRCGTQWQEKRTFLSNTLARDITHTHTHTQRAVHLHSQSAQFSPSHHVLNYACVRRHFGLLQRSIATNRQRHVDP